MNFHEKKKKFKYQIFIDINDIFVDKSKDNQKNNVKIFGQLISNMKKS